MGPKGKDIPTKYIATEDALRRSCSATRMAQLSSFLNMRHSVVFEKKK